jgi:hypothetical protein
MDHKKHREFNLSQAVHVGYALKRNIGMGTCRLAHDLYTQKAKIYR